ncbi:amidohydrolase [Brachybacterium sp. AOP25-B2-12]|uniref:amidohydrolase n=1 Tax=Brachybacterium sp. AOP25-B2-12 TaxID=3457710 RepID=UPI0040346E7D
MQNSSGRPDSTAAPILFTDASMHLGGGRWLRGDLWVHDGRIAALGGRGELDDLVSTTSTSEVTERHDLAGATLLPGFQDAHVHPAIAGLAILEIELSSAASLEEYERIIRQGDLAGQDVSVLTGMGWYRDLLPTDPSPARWLDRIVPGRPVVLTGHDGHSMWLNSASLDRAGIGRGTVDPADGRVERDAEREPTGILLDGAMRLAAELRTEPDQHRLEEALLAAQARLHSVGVTAWQDAMVGVSDLGPDPSAAYARLSADGRLTARVVQALWWDRERGLEQIPELVARREAAEAAGSIAAHVVKIMLDGMVENRTAAMLAPYAGDPSGGCGPSFVDPGLLARAIRDLEGNGFDVHVHTVGDRAVREALDAVQDARESIGPTSRRHQLAHLDVIDPADVPRFARLDVTANLQMLWARRDREIVERKLPLLGAGREAGHFPFGDLERAGARLAAGSDWPVSDPDPLLAIHTGVHRTAARREPLAVGPGVHDVPLEPSQSLTMGAALDACTSGSARANRLEHVTGSLRVGLDADLVVLDQDLRAAAELGAARAVRTLVRGSTVFELRD